ncbi:MAG: hypothetical protein PHY73_07595 [Candidatus Omnitrophica bacterium]|nr:hypothetical protein [Candidatus Omnitrophota bacterium]
MTYNYLQVLKVGHQAIVCAIDQTQGFLRSYREARPRIRSLGEQLATFFSRQDKRMFDQLYAFYAGDRLSTKMIDFLAHDLKDIKVKYLTFFDKHSGEVFDTSASSFPKDFMDFSGQIIGRLKIEEEYLFPLLEKMDQQV